MEAVTVLRLFAQAESEAGVDRLAVSGATVAEALQEASQKLGEGFANTLGYSAIWLNGQPASLETKITDADELAVIPPVSGG